MESGVGLFLGSFFGEFPLHLVTNSLKLRAKASEKLYNGLEYVFNFQPYLETCSNLTYIFQMG